MPVDLAPHKNPRIDALTDAGRLRWIMEFAQRDLNTLTHDAIEAIGDDLRHAAAPWWPHNLEHAPMPPAQVCVLQQEIRQGLQTALSESVPFSEAVKMRLGLKPPQGWELPAPPSFIFLVDENGDSRVWQVDAPTDERTAILRGVANLLYICRDRIYTCPVCGTLFVRHYRQAYCGLRCSNNRRNRRRLDRKADQEKSQKHGVRRVANTASLTTA